MNDNYITERSLTEEDYKRLDEAFDTIEYIMKKMGVNRFCQTRHTNELMFDKITVINRREDVYTKV